jgi:hypothetical protein
VQRFTVGETPRQKLASHLANSVWKLSADRIVPVQALKAVVQKNSAEPHESTGCNAVLKILADASQDDAERIVRDVLTHISALLFTIDEGVASNRKMFHEFL